ncbi:MAG: aldo/keto reductase, partial [Firmicutes bacterium]|nr:aldo/keto reductase [Bacillota bacterium]
CKVDYFDFYLLHNVYENSIPVYTDPQWGIIDYFVEQKRLGRIKHLGFSTHSGNAALEKFLDEYGSEMEFVQIQLNYLDWTLQQAKEKYELLTKRGIPVWVMEPVRGGKLAKLSEKDEALLKEKRPDDSIASWSLRFLQDLPNIAVILSGMSNTAQMIDNAKTFAEEKPLSDEEKELILSIAEGMKSSVPCTACKYCTSGCPMELDIPKFLSTYNEIKIAPSTNSVMYLDALEENRLPSACIKCGKCTQICPQNIDIPQELENFTQVLSKIPKWADICVQRAKLQR